MKRIGLFMLPLVMMVAGAAASGCSGSSTDASSSAWAFENVKYGPENSVGSTWVSGTVRNVSTTTMEIGKVTITATLSDNTVLTNWDPIGRTLEPGFGTRFNTYVKTSRRTVTKWELAAFEKMF